MLEIYHRIASGGQVPPEDEQRLMEYNHELYMAAKTAAMLQEGDGEKYDSLFEDEEEKNGEEKTASEIAGEAEISVPGGGGDAGLDIASESSNSGRNLLFPVAKYRIQEAAAHTATDAIYGTTGWYRKLSTGCPERSARTALVPPHPGQ